MNTNGRNISFDSFTPPKSILVNGNSSTRSSGPKKNVRFTEEWEPVWFYHAGFLEETIIINSISFRPKDKPSKLLMKSELNGTVRDKVVIGQDIPTLECRRRCKKKTNWTKKTKKLFKGLLWALMFCPILSKEDDCVYPVRDGH